jgi:lipopolysaccharide transport system permease protein/teichoic acid transport system permease protein
MSYVFGLVALALMYLVYSHRLTYHILALPAIAFVEFVFMLALAIFFSAANAFYRDIQNVLRHILRLWFYASPAIYSMDQLEHSGIKDLLALNPFTTILESFRNVSYAGAPPEWRGLLAVLAVSFVLLCLSIGLFKRVEPSLAKIL